MNLVIYLPHSKKSEVAKAKENAKAMNTSLSKLVMKLVHDIVQADCCVIAKMGELAFCPTCGKKVS